jgi:hypothetical protein
MLSQIDAVMSRARASLASAGLTVVGEDLARPWGGFLLISQSEVREFGRVYFPNAVLQDVGEQLELRIAAPRLGYVPRNTRTARTRRWSSAAGARLSFAKILVTCLSTARSVITSISAIA